MGPALPGEGTEVMLKLLLGSRSSARPEKGWFCLFDTSMIGKKNLNPRLTISITNQAKLRAFEKCFYNLWLTCSNSCLSAYK